MDDYSRFWFGASGAPRAYTAWLTDAIYARCAGLAFNSCLDILLLLLGCGALACKLSYFCAQ